MPSRAGKFALVRVTGEPTSMTGEAMATSDDQVYTIGDATKRVWDPEAAITVSDDGSPVDPEVDPYTVDRLTGRIIFDDPDAGRGPVTVSGTYLPTAIAARVRAYSWNISKTALDDTDFDSAYQNNGFVSRGVSGLLDVQGTLGRRWDIDDLYFVEALLAGSLFVLEFYSDRDEDPDLICWAMITKSAVQSAVEGLVEEDIDFVGSTDADQRAVSVA